MTRTVCVAGEPALLAVVVRTPSDAPVSVVPAGNAGRVNLRNATAALPGPRVCRAVDEP